MKIIVKLLLLITFLFVGLPFVQEVSGQRRIYRQHRQVELFLYADGINDDTDALNAWGRGEDVRYRNGRRVGDRIENKAFRISAPIYFNRRFSVIRNNLFYVDRYNVPLNFGRDVRGINNRIITEEERERRRKWLRLALPAMLILKL